MRCARDLETSLTIRIRNIIDTDRHVSLNFVHDTGDVLLCRGAGFGSASGTNIKTAAWANLS